MAFSEQKGYSSLQDTNMIRNIESKSILSLFIFICCFIFVNYMTVTCFKKYFKYPQGVNLIIKNETGEITPEYTVCALDEYDQSILQLCNITL